MPLVCTIFERLGGREAAIVDGLAFRGEMSLVGGREVFRGHRSPAKFRPALFHDH